MAASAVFRRRRLFIVIAVLLGMFAGFLLTVYYSDNDFFNHIQFSQASDITKNNGELNEADTFQAWDPEEDDSTCGEICSYTADAAKETKFYPFIRKKVNCRNIIHRLANPPNKVIYPAPRKPPKELYQEFIQYGKSPIKQTLYFDNVAISKSKMKNMEKPKNKNEKQVEFLREADRTGKKIGYKDSYVIKQAIVQYEEVIIGKRGLVVGTLRPWLEAMLLNIGAQRITTSEYSQLDFVHPKIKTTTPYKLGELIMDGKEEKFDFAASFSSIEHSGLGRYGDPLNPYGDLEAVAQVWCMLKPGAYFFLGVPASSDDESYILWNSHRVYGSERLKHLTANFEVVNRFRSKLTHDVFIIKKVSSA